MKTATAGIGAAGHLEAEELMALADGELSGTALRTAEDHVAVCAACAGEVAAFEHQKRALAGWTVEPVPASVEATVLAGLRGGYVVARAEARVPSGWRWVLGGGGALAAGAMAVLFVMTSGGRSARPVAQSSLVAPAVPAGQPGGEEGRMSEAKSAPAPGGADEAVGGMSDRAVRMAQSSQQAPAPVMVPASARPSALAKPSVSSQKMRQPTAVPNAVEAPMIARTVALTLTVKDVERSRDGLENLLRAYGGYAAQMEVNTPEGGVRSLTASLRVPAGALRGMLAELKGYGKVETETQSGEEVGQQHADLAARLSTSRASEERLRAILKTRAGDVSEVLEVEEQIATVREQIEQMEAEQQGLEHRVSYATVDLTLNEEGQGPAARTVASRLAAGARTGWNNAVEAVLGLVTFLLEYGLAAVLVVVMLGLPAWWLWRRWRRVRGRW